MISVVCCRFNIQIERLRAKAACVCVHAACVCVYTQHACVCLWFLFLSVETPVDGGTP